MILNLSKLNMELNNEKNWLDLFKLTELVIVSLFKNSGSRFVSWPETGRISLRSEIKGFKLQPTVGWEGWWNEWGLDTGHHHGIKELFSGQEVGGGLVCSRSCC